MCSVRLYLPISYYRENTIFLLNKLGNVMQNKLVKKPFRINILICQAHVYLITLIMATLYSGVSVSGPCCSQTGLLAPVNVMNQINHL